MADMTASGWYPSNVEVLRSWRPWGPQSLRHALVEMRAHATSFGNGAHLVPREGVPAPLPSTVGFRESIEYIIPVQPFVVASGAAAGDRFLQWGCAPPTYGASGGTVSTGPRLMFLNPVFSLRVSGEVSAANGVTFAGASWHQQAVSALAASDLFTTSLMKGVGIFVGK